MTIGEAAKKFNCESFSAKEAMKQVDGTADVKTILKFEVTLEGGDAEAFRAIIGCCDETKDFNKLVTDLFSDGMTNISRVMVKQALKSGYVPNNIIDLGGRM